MQTLLFTTYRVVLEPGTLPLDWMGRDLDGQRLKVQLASLGTKWVEVSMTPEAALLLGSITSQR